MRPPTLTFRNYHRFTWIWVLLSGFSLLLCSELLSPLSVLLLLAASGWWILAEAGGGAGWLLWGVGLGVGIHSALSKDWVVWASLGLASLVPCFLFRKHKPFGHWIAFLVISLLALMSVIIRNTLREYLVFLFYLAGVLVHLNATFLVELTGPVQSRIQVLPEKFWRQFVPSLVGGTLGAVLIFLFFPRGPAIHNPFGWREKGTDVGYTGSVSLKSASDLHATAALAMTVESSELDWLSKSGSELLFRGNTLDRFDGKDWSLSIPGTSDYSPEVDLRYWHEVEPGLHTVKIYREPHVTRAILYPGVLMSIEAPVQLLSGLSFDGNGNLWRGHSERIRYAYNVVFGVPRLSDGSDSPSLADYRNLLPSVTREEKQYLARFLQNPLSPETDSFFWQWTKELTVRPETKLTGAVQLLAEHFRKKFRATLDYHFGGQNGFQEFLTKGREGHCEYFATAAALYFRSLGVPSRIALGYRGGTFNPLSKVLEVREANAHAWVELFIPGKGWMSFDPTPRSEEPQMSVWDAYWTLYSGAARFWANRYLVNYNDAAQRMLVSEIAGVGRESFSFWKTGWSWSAAKGTYGWGWAFLPLFLGLFFARTKWRKKRDALPSYYRRFRKVAARAGFTKLPQETYAQFHGRIRSPHIPVDWLTEIDQGLERDLYSRS